MSHQRGQALLELAIFGSLIILLLGALVNYGLNADYTQYAMMDSFRQASGPNANSSVLVITDRHIPNPAHPHAVGSLVPTSASASVTRSHQLADKNGSPTITPSLTMKVNDATKTYTLARDTCEGPFVTEEACKAVCRDNPNHWSCDKFDVLFADTRSLGLQPSVSRTNQITSTMTNEVDPAGVNTTAELDWRQDTTRSVLRWDSATQQVVEDVITTTPKDEDTTTTWTTP